MKETQRRAGIVLFYQGRNISVLEITRGRVDAFLYTSLFSKTRVQKGSLITYHAVQDKHQKVLLQNIEIEYVPLEWGRYDIYFLHYMLETCYYFIPEGSGCEATFSFFIFLFNNFALFKAPRDKKIVICKLFSQLGIYPYDPLIQECVEQFLKNPIDNLMQADLQLANEDLLNQWILWCIKTHPQGKWFKAMPMLLKSD